MKAIYSDEYERFLDCLIAARKSADLTQQVLAKKLKKPQSFVSKYERRERRLDVIEFLKIAEAIGEDPSRLLKGIQERRLHSREAK